MQSGAIVSVVASAGARDREELRRIDAVLFRRLIVEDLPSRTEAPAG